MAGAALAALGLTQCVESPTPELPAPYTGGDAFPWNNPDGPGLVYPGTVMVDPGATLIPKIPTAPLFPIDDDDPVVDDLDLEAVRASCLGAALRCSGELGPMRSCELAAAPGLMTARYASGLEARFFESFGLTVIEVRLDNAVCFDTTEYRPGALRLIDRVHYQQYDLRFDSKGDVEVTCPGGATASLTGEQVGAFVPVEPEAALCTVQDPKDECSKDADCGDPELSCCDGGDRFLCAVDCERVEPTERCITDAQCGQGELCCLREDVRVCDVDACGAEGCCFIESGAVCVKEGEPCAR